MTLIADTSEKHVAQSGEKLRKNSLGNYKSAALDRDCCYLVLRF
jgi:hypothetical protein